MCLLHNIDNAQTNLIQSNPVFQITVTIIHAAAQLEVIHTYSRISYELFSLSMMTSVISVSAFGRGRGINENT